MLKVYESALHDSSKFRVTFSCVDVQHSAEYEAIIEGTKGDNNAKRLAADFIAKFFALFPDMAERAIEAELDLCEDEDHMVSALFRIPGYPCGSGHYVIYTCIDTRTANTVSSCMMYICIFITELDVVS